jgi:hypothetical protein
LKEFKVTNIDITDINFFSTREEARKYEIDNYCFHFKVERILNNKKWIEVESQYEKECRILNSILGC